MKKTCKRLWLWVTALAVLLLLLPCFVSGGVYETIFSSRYEAPREATVACRQVSFASGKYTLAGFWYQTPQAAGTVIVVHGMGGGGHLAMEDAILLLTQKGFSVFAFDGTGNGASEGHDGIGFPQTIRDLRAAAEQVQSLSPDEPLFLLGYSLGAYACCCALPELEEVRACAALAAPCSSADMLAQFGQRYGGKPSLLLMPWLRGYEYLKFGSDSVLNAVDGIRQSRARVLLVHSTDDQTVEESISCGKYRQAFQNEERVTFIEYKGRDHTPMYTPEGTWDGALMEKIVAFFQESMK